MNKEMRNILKTRIIFFILLMFFLGRQAVAQGTFYGITMAGGANNSGAIFQFEPATGTYTKRIDLQNVTTGSNCVAPFVEISSKLYTVTNQGGVNNHGTLLEYDPYTNTLVKKVDFEGTVKGEYPRGGMVLYQNKLYGLTQGSGSPSLGALFEYDPGTNVFTKKVDFTAALGTFPNGALTVFGSKLYGMTLLDGANNGGTIFSYDPATGIITKKIDLGGTLGVSPYGSLTLYNNKLYGMTSAGGTYNKGTLFEYDTLTNTVTTKINFDETNNGSNPRTSLEVYNNKLYGMTVSGGAYSGGTLFEYDPSGSTLTTRKDFNNGITGSSPQGTLKAYNNKLYATTGTGGPGARGIFFEYDPATFAFTNLYDMESTTGWTIHGKFLFLSQTNTQTITSWDNIVTEYGGAVNITAVSSSGKPITYTSSDNTIANINSGVLYGLRPGVITVTASLAGDVNYAPFDSTIQVTVNKKLVTVTARDTLRCPLAANPLFKLEYSGFLEEDNETVLDVLPTATASSSSIVGMYPIIPSGGSDAYYALAYVNGTLTVGGEEVTSQILGKDIIAANKETVYYVNPILNSYSYKWTYTGEELQVQGDTISPFYYVNANKNTTSGTILCIVERCGVIDTIRKNITINMLPTFSDFLAEPSCQIYQSNCDSSYLSYLEVEEMFKTPQTTCSASGYSDYTDSDITGTLFLGEAYTLNMEAGGMPGYFGLWIDYNNDGDFGDPQELLSANFDVGFQYIVPNIVVPNLESFKGPRRMRIRTRLSHPFSAGDFCMQENEVGETEDYLIYLDTRPMLEAPNFISPNSDGQNDLFVVRGVNSKETSELIILDRLGKLVYQSNDYQNNWPEPDDKLNNGVYYYIFKNGENEVKSYLEISTK